MYIILYYDIIQNMNKLLKIKFKSLSSIMYEYNHELASNYIIYDVVYILIT